NKTFYPGDHWEPGTMGMQSSVITFAGRLRRLMEDKPAIFYCPTLPSDARWKLEFPTTYANLPETHPRNQTITKVGYLVGEEHRIYNKGFSYGYNGWGV
ncbi:MAG: hypothetical protein JNK70_14575, partial [Phycisphaerae bacterium]|nr:hypothetical protein [Phycisphaerae bacterium]